MPLDGTNYEIAKPDVFSLEGLIAWLRTQDPATEYDFLSNDDCLLCRYLRANGYPKARMSGYGHARLNGISDVLHQTFKFESSAAGPVTRQPWTYGAALERALSHET